jgi:phenylacetate-coenzyme A ligase PaaK-like adenylate-forming protein
MKMKNLLKLDKQISEHYKRHFINKSYKSEDEKAFDDVRKLPARKIK